MSLSLPRAAHDSLAATVETLTSDDLDMPSCADGWTVAQVLSHLGSGAEICTVLLQRGIDGDPRGPSREELLPVWQRWDALPPASQALAWEAADHAHLDLLASLDERQWQDVRVPYFIGPLSVTEYVGYRLSEAVVHAWDIQAARDPEAKLLAEAQPALLHRIDLVASRFRDGSALAEIGPVQIAVRLEGGGDLTLHLGGELHLWACSGEVPDGFLDTDVEGLLRLVYGRHSDPISVTGVVTEDQLRALFPGF